jgi:predicted transcriptional regulator
VGNLPCETRIKIGTLKICDSMGDNTWWAGVEKEFFDRYYGDSNRAIAYELGKITVFKEPRSLEDYGILHAPQSFAYV